MIIGLRPTVLVIIIWPCEKTVIWTDLDIEMYIEILKYIELLSSSLLLQCVSGVSTCRSKFVSTSIVSLYSVLKGADTCFIPLSYRGGILLWIMCV